MHKRNFATGAFVSIFLCFIIASTMLVQAQTSRVGVSEGNTFVYDRSSNFNSIYDESPSTDILGVNQTLWIKVAVTGASDTLISSQVTTHYRNGTEKSGNVTCDIENGETTGGPPFIESNLGQNGLVNPSAAEPWFINETVTRTYKDITRETNHLRFEFNDTSEDIGDYTSIFDYWFDKSTGALVEYTSEFINSGATTEIHSKLISTNLWETNEKLPDNSEGDNSLIVPAVAAAVAVIVIIAVIVVFRKKGAKETAESPDSEDDDEEPVKPKTKVQKKSK